MRALLCAVMAGLPLTAALPDDVAQRIRALPAATDAAPRTDWLVAAAPATRAAAYRGPGPNEIELSNGLIRRRWRLEPNAASVALDNLQNRQALLRSVRPEATVTIDGRKYAIGGLLGQVEHAYLRTEWLDKMTADPAAFRFTGFETGATRARFPWKRVRYSENRPWPPPGAALTLRFEPPANSGLGGLAILVHYEMYDGIPALAKWLELRNGANRRIRLDSFTAEILAAVEFESQVEGTGPISNPHIQVETDYSFVATHPASNVHTVAQWLPDKQYTTQVNYRLKTPLLLEVRPPLGPALEIEPGGTFESFRVFELIHDSTERERRGLAVRRMYRTVGAVGDREPDADARPPRRPGVGEDRHRPVRRGRLRDGDHDLRQRLQHRERGPGLHRANKALVDYGRSKGVELGGYSLLASRKISPEDDVINPKTGKRGGAIFGDSPCLGSRWGNEYFRKLTEFIEQHRPGRAGARRLVSGRRLRLHIPSGPPRPRRFAVDAVEDDRRLLQVVPRARRLPERARLVFPGRREQDRAWAIAR